ncbi:hypothetical protein BTVI_106306 [Pitangus sulphuratus]|nr:hypothetical protein BTVI_106306 [Pitangus sulphuratus]
MLSLMPPRTGLTLLAARALLTHAQLAISQDPQVPFRGTAFQHLIPQSVQTSRVSPSQVQNPALPLIKFDMVGDCPVLSFVQVSLQGLLAFEGVNSSSQFCVICKLAQYPFESCVQVIYEDVEEQRAQDGALWNPTSDRLPVQCYPIHCHPLCLTMSQLLTHHMMCLSSCMLDIFSEGYSERE